MSAPQERAALVRLVELRRERWAALVSLPALRAAVLANAIEASAKAPGEALEATEADGLLESSVTGEAVDFDESLGSPVDFVACPSLVAVAAAEAASSEAALVARLETLDVDGTVAERLVDAALAAARGAAQDELPGEMLADVGPEELARYHERVRGSADRYLRARNRFVCSNLRLVAMVADRYSGRSMALADRVQEGNLGLIKAVERFDPEHGTRFSTYAVWWIRHAITRALVDRGRTVRIPAHLHAIFTKVRAVRTELEGRLGRPARMTELADAVELPVGKVRVAIEAMSLRAVALDASENDDDQPSWGDRLGTPAPQAEIDAQMDACRNETLACRALANLGVMERHILERRFELHGVPRMTLEALGQHYHLSRERIRQIQNRALAAIRHEVETSPVSGLALA